MKTFEVHFRKGFTLIEILVAIGIIVILTSVGIASFTSSRVNARNGRRKSDVQTVLSAMTQYVNTRGSTFIQDADPITHAVKDCIVPDATDTTQVVDNSAGGCVGALGRSYGKINLTSATTDGYGGQSTKIHPGRLYASTSISTALKDGGYLDTVARDPLSVNQSTTDPNLRDYVLIRACRNGGQQSVGKNGSIFAIWTSLENAPSAAETSIANQLPGGSAVEQANIANYQFDYAAMQSEFQAGLYSTLGYAVGNGGSAALADSLDCAGNPKV